MPKMKTKKCATKRMKLSKNGKIMRSQGGHAHLQDIRTRPPGTLIEKEDIYHACY